MNIKLIVFLTFVLGAFSLYKQTVDYDLAMRGSLLEHIKIANSAINSDRVLNLKGNETDYTNIDYIRLKDQLTGISEQIENARYVYIMAKKDNKTVLMVDTQPKKYGLAGLAEPGEIYEEFDPNIEDLLKNAGEKTTGPYTDKWGTFVSGLSSIVNKNDGSVVAMVGVDVETKILQRGLWQSLISRFVMLVLVVMLELIVFKGQKKNLKDSSRLAYLAAVLESSNDAIYSIDFDKKILAWNLGAEKLYGYSSVEVIGKDMTEMLLPDGEVEKLNKILELIRTGRRIEPKEVMRKTKSGKLIAVSIILSPVFNSKNEVTSVSVIARDVTKQKVRDLELEKHNAELEKMNKLMLDRELIMMDLKKKIKQYENK